MKYIKILIILLSFISCHRKTAGEILDKDPSYKVITTFSKKFKHQTGLELAWYGVNRNLPKEYQFKNEVVNFHLGYFLINPNKDEAVSLNNARKLIVLTVDSFLKTVNSDPKVIPKLEVFPMTEDLLQISIHFKDQQQVDLGQGVAVAYFTHGKIRYEGYKISEYNGSYPAVGEHYLIYEETYAEALEALKKNGP